MIPTALRQFITDLQSATESRAVEWTNGITGNTYICSHKTFDLHLGSHLDEDTETSFYMFRIKNGSQDVTFTVTDNEGDYRTMANLAAAIRVNASKIDLSLNEFFS